LFASLREETVGVVEGEAEGNIWAEGKERGRRMKNRPIK
jgi:hypothetical protein